MAHYVTCPICQKRFNRDKEPCISIGRRYAHIECAKEEENKKTKEQKDLEELEKYIIRLLRIDYIDARVRKQINLYVKENNYTYSGILKALKYFYEIKGNPIDKANGGIGIVPYIYRQAYEYYYSIWQAQQTNNDKNVEAYIPKEKKIVIKAPQRPVKKRRLFTFLDEEENEN